MGRIAIADRNDLQRGILEEVLKNMGHAVIAAPSSLEELCETNETLCAAEVAPEGIVMERLESMERTAAAIRRLRIANRKARIVVCGEWKSAADVKAAAMAGAAAVIAKPYFSESSMARMKSAFAAFATPKTEELVEYAFWGRSK